MACKLAPLPLLTAALLTAGAAQAAEPDYTLAYNVTAVSDYRFRGIEQSAGQPSLQAGVDWTHKSGVYAGAFFANNIKWIKEFNGASKGDFEIDLLVGYKGALKSGWGYDLGVTSYLYPDNDSGGARTPGGTNYTRADTTEVYAGVSYGMASLKYFQSVGDFLGNVNSNGSRYWDLSLNFDLGNGLMLTPHVGYQTIPNQNSGTVTNGTAANYSDYALTLAKDFGNGFSASIAAVGTDAKEGAFYNSTFYGSNRFLARSGVIVSVKYSF